MTEPENPFAFPMSMPDGYWQNGMPLRDWFAGLALSGALSSDGDGPLHIEPGQTGETVEQVRGRGMKRRALWCYAQADAMLAARGEGRL